MTATPSLDERLGQWFTGWAALRGYATATEGAARAALRHDRSEDWEYFLADPAQDAVDAAAALVRQSPRRALSVVGAPGSAPGDWAHTTDLAVRSASETFMALDLQAAPAAPTEAGAGDAAGLRLTRRAPQEFPAGALFDAALLRDDVVLASGQLAVLGGVAVFDTIATPAEHRRRGYGRLLMDALAAHARELSAATGLLLASTDGRHLYTTLGWHELGPVTVYGTPP